MTTFHFQASGTKEEIRQQLQDHNEVVGNQENEAKAAGVPTEGTSYSMSVPDEIWEIVQKLLDWMEPNDGPKSVNISGSCNPNDPNDHSISVQVHNR
jgi:hypothetical protein